MALLETGVQIRDLLGGCTGAFELPVACMIAYNGRNSNQCDILTFRKDMILLVKEKGQIKDVITELHGVQGRNVAP